MPYYNRTQKGTIVLTTIHMHGVHHRRQPPCIHSHISPQHTLLHSPNLKTTRPIHSYLPLGPPVHGRLRRQLCSLAGGRLLSPVCSLEPPIRGQPVRTKRTVKRVPFAADFGVVPRRSMSSFLMCRLANMPSSRGALDPTEAFDLQHSLCNHAALSFGSLVSAPRAVKLIEGRPFQQMKQSWRCTAPAASDLCRFSGKLSGYQQVPQGRVPG